MNDSDPLAADKQAVTDLVHRIFSTYQQFDPDRLNECDAPECTIWDLFEPELVQGGPEARKKFRQKDMSDSVKRGPLSIDIEPPVVDIWDDFAVARYYLNYEFQPPGALKGAVRITTVARRIDGEWKRVHHHEGAVPTGRPPLTAD
ncbi:MAG: nuclear transport factor 2 family protein [Gammaproteobacteria bacterium]|nr:nuclear transport factor 2 family protein [Gammaproteobacteria bacterium]